MMGRIALGLLAGLVALLELSVTAVAHPLAPGLLEIQEYAGGRLEMRWKRPLFAGGMGMARPVLPAPCREAAIPDREQTPESLTWRWEADCGDLRLSGQRVTLTGLERGASALARVRLVDGRTVQAMLSASSPALTIPPREAPLRVASSYFVHGLEHLFSGPDHLLFVAGLVWLLKGGRRLFWTITAFTAGHSVTLALAAMGGAVFPASVVELWIAGTILLLGLELSRAGAQAPGLIARRPWSMALVFGLLHGMGFAGALLELGMPPAGLSSALLSFNLGIEAGQLGVVAALMGARWGLGRWGLPVPRWTGLVPAYVVGSMAAFWCVERVAALWRVVG